ncbi:amidohydrolase/deacetylase family metallohydrolase [Alkalibaculum sp. M08DMB]|uniref:Amidohydrolase/deacetylase family metallohydrolase n=1 Tax=Alkalibaculum sporogenes TaxID=2655001 RepID=A0A6A7K7W5_9FIRM|nr:amidohydrolase/deacetylase family metallohydrolase [Alkalibaculum sporogenes]MPW25578.1 amidohydrolase/deacetylase family metallohydrolase [Alkalibaculum sporogenes]
MNEKIVLKGGMLVDSNTGYRIVKKDIMIQDGKITAVEKVINVTDAKVIDITGKMISPGFIDAHTHCYTATSLGVKPDDLGIQRGVTTIFDAGSSGPENFEDFLNKDIKSSSTKVFALLNIASNGLINTRYELADLTNIKVEEVIKTYEKYTDYIVGIKARASASTVGELGIKPIQIAKEIAEKLDLPLVVHIGNLPPRIEDVLNLMGKNDVITHCFHGKKNGLLDENGLIKKETKSAIKRGVRFDVGHGSSSFSFLTARKALEQGFKPDMISTDMYNDNMNGPVYSLEMTINKMIAIGLDFKDAIKAITQTPAEIFRLDGYGTLAVGSIADLTVYELKEQQKTLVDSDENIVETSKIVKTEFIIKSGEIKKVTK